MTQFEILITVFAAMVVVLLTIIAILASDLKQAKDEVRNIKLREFAKKEKMKKWQNNWEWDTFLDAWDR